MWMPLKLVAEHMQIIFHWFSFINDILNFLLFLVIVLIFVHKGFWYSTGDMWMHSSMVACMLNICKLYSTRSSCRCFFDSFIDDILNFFVFLPFVIVYSQIVNIQHPLSVQKMAVTDSSMKTHLQ